MKKVHGRFLFYSRQPTHKVKPHSFSKPFSHRIVTNDSIKEALKQVKYPGFSRDIVSFGLVRSAAFVEGTAKVSIAIATADAKIPLFLKNEVEKCLRAIPGVKEIIVDVAVSAPKTPASG